LSSNAVVECHRQQGSAARGSIPSTPSYLKVGKPHQWTRTQGSLSISPSQNFGILESWKEDLRCW
jgi:hypothetical protein